LNNETISRLINSPKYLAEDLRGGDEEYVHWSGELQLRERIARDIEQLKCIEYVHH
jgi:hypothetical protein